MKLVEMQEEDGWFCDAEPTNYKCRIEKGESCYSCEHDDHRENDGYFVSTKCAVKQYSRKCGQKMRYCARDDSDYFCDEKYCKITLGEKCYQCNHLSHGEDGYVVCTNCIKSKI